MSGVNQLAGRQDPAARLGMTLALALALCALVAPRVEAHARYARSEPGADATVSTAPDELRVWFTEAVRNQGSRLEVVNAAGARVDRGDGRVDMSLADRRLMRVSLPPLPDGVYTVRWRTVSADDGDQADGTFRFTVRGATSTPAPTPTPTAPPTPAPTPTLGAPAPAAEPVPPQSDGGPVPPPPSNGGGAAEAPQ